MCFSTAVGVQTYGTRKTGRRDSVSRIWTSSELQRASEAQTSETPSQHLNLSEVGKRECSISSIAACLRIRTTVLFAIFLRSSRLSTIYPTSILKSKGVVIWLDKTTGHSSFREFTSSHQVVSPTETMETSWPCSLKTSATARVAFA